MTQEEFIKLLHDKSYSYEIRGDKVIVTHNSDVMFYEHDKTPIPYIGMTLPPGVEFQNEGSVRFYYLKGLPGIEDSAPVVFKNKGDVWLDKLMVLPPGVEFKNTGDVRFNYLSVISARQPGVEFQNGKNVFLGGLDRLPYNVKFMNGGIVWFQNNGYIGGLEDRRIMKRIPLGSALFKNDWPGKIEGVSLKRLLNIMIQRGFFEK